MNGSVYENRTTREPWVLSHIAISPHRRRGQGQELLKDLPHIRPGGLQSYGPHSRNAVDDYLETCKKLNREPNHSYSGQFRLRLSPKLHARAAMVAETKGKSLNAWVADAIERSIASA